MNSDRKQALDLSRILNSSHEGKWIAIAPDYSRVVAAADSLRDLMRTTRDEPVIYHRALPANATFAPTIIGG